MEALWHSFLKLIEPIIIPDWAALIGLLPVFLALAIVLWLLATVRHFATAGPARRGPARLAPVAPAGIHMPGPSLAPALAAGGLFLLFYGLVLGGMLLWIGLGALILALLYWLREGLHDYDRVAGVEKLPAVGARALPAVTHAPPPAGVHVPGPSFRPLLASLALALLVFGLVFGGWILAVGVLALVVALVGWLRDARAEYVKTEEADSTGHLENIAAPRAPVTLIGAFALLAVVAVLFQAGILPPKSGGTTAPSPTVGPSGAPAAADFTIDAKGIAYDNKAIEVSAGKTFTILFKNDDPSTVPHDVDIRSTDGKTVLKNQATITGGQQVVYDYDALAAGTYQFICSVHPIPAMTGTLTVK